MKLPFEVDLVLDIRAPLKRAFNNNIYFIIATLICFPVNKPSANRLTYRSLAVCEFSVYVPYSCAYNQLQTPQSSADKTGQLFPISQLGEDD